MLTRAGKHRNGIVTSTMSMKSAEMQRLCLLCGLTVLYQLLAELPVFRMDLKVFLHI